MHKIALYFGIFCLSVLSLGAAEIPQWFLDSKLKSNPPTFIGYGEDKELNRAIANAKDHIAAQISTKIDASFEQNKIVSDRSYKKETKQTQKQKIKANIFDSTVVKKEHHDGVWYVAVGFDNISIIDKFIKKLPKDLSDEKQNPYLAKTELFYKLHAQLGKNIDAKIMRKDENWYVVYQDAMQVLDERSFEELFSSIKNDKLQFSFNSKKPIVFDGDTFNFVLSTSKDGFVTIFDVFEDGSVAILAQNIKVAKHKTKMIPDEVSNDIFEAGILEKNKDSFDLFVAIASDTPLNTDSFVLGAQELSTSEKAKKFDKLIELMGQYEFASIKVNVRAK